VVADPYADLAARYDAAWPAPPAELFDLLRAAGVAPDARVLDVGAGTGLASAPLARAGARVTAVDPSPAMLALARTRLPGADLVNGRAESLRFSAGAFDAAVSGDAFHCFEQTAAMAELTRVVRTGGTLAIWWRTLSTEGDMPGHRAAATHDLGFDPVPEPMRGGFRAFYAAPLAERAVRTVASAVRTTVDGWIAIESAREEVRAAYGERATAWIDALRARLLAAYGAPDAPLAVRTLHYVYFGRV